jgi:hypothetical protein
MTQMLMPAPGTFAGMPASPGQSSRMAEQVKRPSLRLWVNLTYSGSTAILVECADPAAETMSAPPASKTYR